MSNNPQVLKHLVTTTAFIHMPGTPAEAIPSLTTQVDLLVRLDEDWDRDAIREHLSDCFSQIYDGAVNVWFSDECPDCIKIKKDGKCMNPNCITGIHNVEEQQELNLNDKRL